MTTARVHCWVRSVWELAIRSKDVMMGAQCCGLCIKPDMNSSQEESSVKYVIAASLLFLVSCSPTIRVVSDYSAADFVITELKGSSARLYVGSNVDVLEFKKSFEGEYNSKSEFISTFTTQLTDKLGSLAQISNGRSEQTDMLFLGLSF